LAQFHFTPGFAQDLQRQRHPVADKKWFEHSVATVLGGALDGTAGSEALHGRVPVGHRKVDN